MEKRNKLQRCRKKVTKGPDIVVSDFKNAFDIIFALNCSFYFTIYTPYDSLSVHNTLKWGYRGQEKSLTFHVHERNHNSEKAHFY